jgi:hypothetical protein
MVPTRSSVFREAVLVWLAAAVAAVRARDADPETFRVAVPGGMPAEDDAYLCVAFRVDRLVPNAGGPVYVERFEAEGDADGGRRILLQTCRVVGDQVRTAPTFRLLPRLTRPDAF